MVSHIANQYYDQKKVDAESWNNAVLYQPYEAEQILIAENASCLAVKTFLHMSNLDFSIKTCANAEFMSPGGRITKLPFIQVGSFVVPEMELIVNFVEGKGKSLTTNLDADQKNDLRAYMSLTENIFSYAELYVSWMDEETLVNVTKPRNGVVFPWPLNVIQNWRKRRHFLKLLDTYEWRNISMEQVVEKVAKCCESLTELLGAKPYFYGNTPSELDALVFGHIFTILTTKLPNNALAETVRRFGTLMDFCTRINETYFGK